MFEDDAEEDEKFIASESESEAKSTGSEPTNSDSEEEVIVKKRKVTTRKTREENKEDLVKGIVFRLRRDSLCRVASYFSVFAIFFFKHSNFKT